MPVAAVIGAWDPIMPAHHKLFEQLCTEAQSQFLASCAILLDPHPATFLRPVSQWPAFDDVHTKTKLLTSSGIECILVVNFSAADLTAGALDLFELVATSVVLAELWLGETQSLGSGPGGSIETIDRLARERDIRLRRLPSTNGAALGSSVRTYLSEGRLRDASAVVGRMPVRHQSSSYRLETSWRQGHYHAMGICEGVIVEESRYIQMVSDPDGQTGFQWPAPEIERVVFLNGPGDHKHS
jgi:FAD synthase